MATNNFKPFATGTGANVTAQAEYEALTALLTGFASGKASSAQVNKALRQSTFVAAALAQFIQNKSAIDVLDDGDLAGFVTDLGNALNKHSQPLDAGLTSLAALAGGANLLPYYTAADVFAQTSLTAIGRSLIGQSTQASALSYLGGAPLASPTFTGIPAAPTAAAGINTTQVATTAFVGAAITAATGRLLNVQTFTSSGTYTPTAGTTRVVVEAVAGGGGSVYVPAQGGSQVATASGAGGGSYAIGYYASGFSGVAVTIGAGGTAGIAASSTTPTAGGNTSFGSLINTYGGAASAALSVGTTTTGCSAGAVGGAYPTGTFIYGARGGTGQHGLVLGMSLVGGAGGASGKGACAPNGLGNGNAGATATGYGAGAGGGAVGVSGSGVNGGAGAPGIVIIWEYA